MSAASRRLSLGLLRQPFPASVSNPPSSSRTASSRGEAVEIGERCDPHTVSSLIVDLHSGATERGLLPLHSKLFEGSNWRDDAL